MTSKKIPCCCIFFTIIFSVIFLACDNTMIEKQNSDFSVKIPISQFYNDNSSVSSRDSVYVIEAWVKNKNTTLQTISQNVIPGETSVTIDFKNIPVGQKVKVYIKLTQDQNTIYEGSSDWVIIKMGKNNIKINIKGDFSQPEQPTTYTVTFNSQGGSSVDTQTVDAAGIATKPEDPTKDNCVFEYWCTDSNCQNKFNFETAITGDITLYAKWRDANQVASVGFDPATGSVDKNTLVTLSCETENATIYYNFENKEFNVETWQNDGWKQYSTEGIWIFDDTSNETTNTLYAIAVYDGMKNSEKTFATYTLAEYTVIFNTCYEIPIDNLKVESGNEIILKQYSQFNRDGYNFEGWYFDEERTKSVGESGILYPSKNLANTENEINLYAKWTPITYTVQFYSNVADGSVTGTMENQSFTYDVAQDLQVNTFTREGYTFVGWNTVPDGSGETYTDGASIKNLTAEKNTTINLYAQWVQAQQVSSWVDLANLIKENNKGGDSLEIFVNDDLTVTEDGFDLYESTTTYITINSPVKLIGNKEITISYADNIPDNSHAGFFNIESQGFLTIEGITMSGNENSSGPLIYSLGNLSLKNCNLINNISSSAGGAIYFGNSEDDVLSLDNVEISGCTSSFGATYVPVAATINLKDVTISGTDVSSSFYVLPTVSTNLSGKIEIGNYYINNEFDRSLELIKVIELDISSKVNVNFVTNDNIKGKNLLEENSSQYRGCFSLPEGYEIKEDGTINLQQSE